MVTADAFTSVRLSGVWNGRPTCRLPDVTAIRNYGFHRVALAVVCLLTLMGGSVHAQGRSDVVTLANGDRITGEIVRLNRGQLEFKTDDTGTLYLEWDKLVSLTATTRQFDVTTSEGLRFLGSLGRAGPRSIAIVAASTATLAMSDVTHVDPVGSTFWRKLDGSISAGFTYTKSTEVAQLNLNADSTYRRPGFEVQLAGAYTATATEDDPELEERASFAANYARFLTSRWVLSGIGSVETNEGIGLALRTEAGAGIGPRVVDTNRAQLWFGGGLMVNHEKGIDVEPTENIEAVFFMRTSYFTYDRPKTTIDIDFQYLPSLNDLGRHRLELDANIRRELLRDLIVSLNLFDSYDNRPPNAEFDSNDLGVVLSIGWTF